jgi:hypothetical protein
MSFGVTMKVKNMFFDRALVKREVGKQNAAALGKIGAFVRRRARSSMRRRKSASAPGHPPSAHSKDPVATLKNILFAYDRANMSVVIGPVLLNGSRGSVPALHEFGGAANVREKKIVNPLSGQFEWAPTGRRGARPGQQTRIRQAQYAARPFMGPALAAEAPGFPSLWVTSAGGRAA